MPGLRNGRLLLRELAGRLLVKLVPAMRSDRFQMVLVGVCLTSALVGARQQRGLSVRGVVLDGVTKRPVAEATVALVGMAGSSSRTETDGRFFLSLQRPAAGLRLQATKPGYLTGYLGQLGPNDTLGKYVRSDRRSAARQSRRPFVARREHRRKGDERAGGPDRQGFRSGADTDDRWRLSSLVARDGAGLD